MDLMEVREATTEALRRVRAGNGPVFIEAMTYRYRGHSMADPVKYRENSEVEEWRINDPIDRFKALALEEGLITSQEMEQIQKEVAETIAEAIDYATKSPFPDLGSIYDNVYA